MASLARVLLPLLLLGCLLTVLVSQVSAAEDISEDSFDDGVDDENYGGEFSEDGGEDDESGELDDEEGGEHGGWNEEEETVDESDVVMLTAENFDQVISDNEYVLVAFTASWCGHCKSLTPKYAAAATTLKSQGSKIVLGKCDASVETSIAQKYKVEGFPTINFFVNGKESAYGGGRESDDIIAWLKKKTGPPAETIESEGQAKDILESQAVLGAGYFSKFEGDAWSSFEKVARQYDGVAFVQFSDPSLAPLFNFAKGVKPPAFAIVKKDAEKFTQYGGEFAVEPLSSFVAENKLPLVITFSMETADQIFDSQIKHQIILFAKPEEYKTLSPVYSEAAKSFKGKAIFVYVDTGNEEESQSVVEFFGIGASKPAVMAFHADTERAPSKYRHEGDITTEAVKVFVDGVLTKKIKPHYKSDPIPEKNDDDVVVIVGKNFDDIVLDKTKDVLLEVYAPWCGHCQQLEPTYKKLAALFKDVDSVVIAKMDGTTNEHQLASVEGFPTLLFFPADNKENSSNVDSGRSLKALTKYIQKSASIPFTLSESAQAELAADDGPEQEEEDGYPNDDDLPKYEDDQEDDDVEASEKDEL